MSPKGVRRSVRARVMPPGRLLKIRKGTWTARGMCSVRRPITVSRDVTVLPDVRAVQAHARWAAAEKATALVRCVAKVRADRRRERGVLRAALLHPVSTE